ncbi:polysaccharide biosynthesis protein GtrA [Bacillus sp. MUM 116]|uniref:GtrA family protein n=1 Tax=Bacillus sp. MUM 116 TaxID=1678002 RepID=UPI0008F5BE35|nr:GtrA family protein [Bacillus sp. MUM 116]OIK15654.1 polysaccharide biosynthesis protein GtrA [Bacillus sp. MUM 116]
MKYSFIRFIMVGVLNTIVGLSVMYLLLHAFHLSYWISTFIGNSVGAVVSFFLNRSFTFKSNNTVSKSAIRFIIVILCCYFISYDLAKNLVSAVLYSNHFFSGKITTDMAVLVGTGLYTVLNYLGQKLFVYSKKGVAVETKS